MSNTRKQTKNNRDHPSSFYSNYIGIFDAKLWRMNSLENSLPLVYIQYQTCEIEWPRISIWTVEPVNQTRKMCNILCDNPRIIQFKSYIVKRQFNFFYNFEKFSYVHKISSIFTVFSIVFSLSCLFCTTSPGFDYFRSSLYVPVIRESTEHL